jgi:hypothetical protein
MLDDDEKLYTQADLDFFSANADEYFEMGNKLRKERDKAVIAASQLKVMLKRATFIAEHLFQMISQDVWRDSGGDDMQGHYESDYHAEIESWKSKIEEITYD